MGELLPNKIDSDEDEIETIDRIRVTLDSTYDWIRKTAEVIDTLNRTHREMSSLVKEELRSWTRELSSLEFRTGFVSWSHKIFSEWSWIACPWNARNLPKPINFSMTDDLLLLFLDKKWKLPELAFLDVLMISHLARRT